MQILVSKEMFLGKEICQKIQQMNTEEGNKLVIGGISTKNRLSHFLLRLKWDDKPMTYFSNKGWCFMNEDLGE